MATGAVSAFPTAWAPLAEGLRFYKPRSNGVTRSQKERCYLCNVCGESFTRKEHCRRHELGRKQILQILQCSLPFSRCQSGGLPELTNCTRYASRSLAETTCLPDMWSHVRTQGCYLATHESPPSRGQEVGRLTGRTSIRYESRRVIRRLQLRPRRSDCARTSAR